MQCGWKARHKMKTQQIATYICFGFSFVIVLLEAILSGQLWKSRFSQTFLYISLIYALIGTVLELTKYLGQATGLTIVTMGIPLYYLANFQLFRLIFKKNLNTEPYVTVYSRIGSPPNGIFASENNDGDIRSLIKIVRLWRRILFLVLRPISFRGLY